MCFNMVEYPGIEPGMSKTADLQSTASPLMLLLHKVYLLSIFKERLTNFLVCVYYNITLRCCQHIFLLLAETVRFELTDHFWSTVFKTVAINRTLPHFHCQLLSVLIGTPCLIRTDIQLLLRESALPISVTGHIEFVSSCVPHIATIFPCK